jgi:predicted DNA-binding transcriptional regulator AlpA
MTQFVGVTEIASRLGVSRQRAHNHIQRKDFPDPLVSLAQDRVWRAQDIERWIRRNPQYDHSRDAP